MGENRAKRQGKEAKRGGSISDNYNQDKRFRISGQKKWAPCMKFN